MTTKWCGLTLNYHIWIQLSFHEPVLNWTNWNLSRFALILIVSASVIKLGLICIQQWKDLHTYSSSAINGEVIVFSCFFHVCYLPLLLDYLYNIPKCKSWCQSSLSWPKVLVTTFRILIWLMTMTEELMPDVLLN